MEGSKKKQNRNSYILTVYFEQMFVLHVVLQNYTYM